MIWQFSVILCSDYILIYPSSTRKKLREDENLIYRPSPAIAISFFCRDVPCSKMGRAGDHPGIDEGGNCTRAKLSFAAGDQTEPFFWMKFLNSFLIFYNHFPHHSAIHITWSIRPTESKSGCEVAATTFPRSSSSRLFSLKITRFGWIVIYEKSNWLQLV